MVLTKERSKLFNDGLTSKTKDGSNLSHQNEKLGHSNTTTQSKGIKMIEITEFKGIDKGSFKSQVSIKVPKWGGFIIKRINVFANNENRWFSFPSQEFEKDGKKMYFKYNDFDTQEMNDAFRLAFFKAYDDYITKNNSNLNNAL